jgi:hypothetical protein
MPEGTQTVTIFAAVLAGIGVVLVLAYLALGARRSYLLYLGLSLLTAAAAIFMGGPARILFAIVTIALMGYAFYEALQESKNRWLQMQVAQREREDAFALVLEAQTRKDIEEEEEQRAAKAAAEGRGEE